MVVGRYMWLSLLSVLAVLSVVVVFYWPRLRLPDSPEFQLFAHSHPFEQYDTVFKHHFWFERPQKVSSRPRLYLVGFENKIKTLHKYVTLSNNCSPINLSGKTMISFEHKCTNEVITI